MLLAEVTHHDDFFLRTDYLSEEELKTLTKMRRIMVVPQAMRDVLDLNDDVRRHVRIKVNLSWPPPKDLSEARAKYEGSLEMRVLHHELCSGRISDPCNTRNCWAAWSHAFALSAAGAPPRVNNLENSITCSLIHSKNLADFQDEVSAVMKKVYSAWWRCDPLKITWDNINFGDPHDRQTLTTVNNIANNPLLNAGIVMVAKQLEHWLVFSGYSQ